MNLASPKDVYYTSDDWPELTEGVIEAEFEVELPLTGGEHVHAMNICSGDEGEPQQ